MTAAAHDHHRTDLWLPLVRELTQAVPGWVLIKNAEAAFDGVGDIDSMAPVSDWPAIERIFRRWADDRGLTVLGVCRHIWRGPNLVARDPASRYLLVLDVKTVRTFRGSPLIDVRAANEASLMDPAGFRRVRPGAEGILKLLHNGTTRRAGPNRAGLTTKDVAALLRADPEGADLAAGWVGRAAPALRRAARSAADGRWSRRDMLLVEARCLVRDIVHPVGPARQLWLRSTGERCPFVRLTRREHRRLPVDGDAWVAAMEASHRDSSFLTSTDGVAA